MWENSKHGFNWGGKGEGHQTENLFETVSGMQQSKEESEKQQQQDKIDKDNKEIEKNRQRLEQEDKSRNPNNQPEATSTKSNNKDPVTTLATNRPSSTSKAQKQSQVEAPQTLSSTPTSTRGQTGTPRDNPTPTITPESEVGTHDGTFSRIVTSSISGTDTQERPTSTDFGVPTVAPQHSLNSGQIAAIVISSIGLAIILLIAVFLLLRFRRHQHSHPSPSPVHPETVPPNYSHPYNQLLSPPPPPPLQTPQDHADIVKPRRTISRWLSQVRAESRTNPSQPPSVSLPSSSSHSGSGGHARTRGQPDMVSDISSQISGFTHPTVTVSSGGRSFRPPTQLRPPTGSSTNSSDRNMRETKPVHPSIYVSPATATNSSGSVNITGLLPEFPLPPGRMAESGDPVSPMSPSPVESFGADSGLGMGMTMGNGARLSGLGVQGQYEQEYHDEAVAGYGYGGVKRQSWETNKTLEQLEVTRRSVSI
ncbi:hypothetical protein QBC40DRAFT_347144 [Triangularia verruculosa]|uniref:Uncharacterized protein n=1 Tax=Triangularia verruculosa TaxID=2587418 RepID=A0AAN6XKD2_9PEZI|nr:hypothetical protein QBC40DRAFT_347144 [Triangularia verruculosa]